jgi:hypothetical protein
MIHRVVCATNIQKSYFLDRHLISTTSTAARSNWALLKQTTGAEDVAYGLLWLVNVNMPALCREGARAFYRLQLEIIKRMNEHTVFA